MLRFRFNPLPREFIINRVLTVYRGKKYPDEEKTIKAILPIILTQNNEERGNISYRLYTNKNSELAESIKNIMLYDSYRFFLVMIIVIFILLVMLILKSAK